jgi:hypothetical protein
MVIFNSGRLINRRIACFIYYYYYENWFFHKDWERVYGIFFKKNDKEIDTRYIDEFITWLNYVKFCVTLSNSVIVIQKKKKN